MESAAKVSQAMNLTVNLIWPERTCSLAMSNIRNMFLVPIEVTDIG